LSGIIDKKNEQLKELDNLAQATFYDMFGDLVHCTPNAKIKDVVCEMFIGPFGSSLKTDCYVDEDKGFCQIYEQKHAIKKTIDIPSHFIDEEKYNSLKRFAVSGGDYIMSCRGTIGELYRLPKDAPLGVIHPSLMKIRINEDTISPVYFEWFLSKIMKEQKTNGGVIKMAITAKSLKEIGMYIPPRPEQEDFANKIEAIEHQKSLIKQSIQETQTLLDATMDKYFG